MLHAQNELTAQALGQISSQALLGTAASPPLGFFHVACTPQLMATHLWEDQLIVQRGLEALCLAIRQMKSQPSTGFKHLMVLL